jgi:hypothetical protein
VEKWKGGRKVMEGNSRETLNTPKQIFIDESFKKTPTHSGDRLSFRSKGHFNLAKQTSDKACSSESPELGSGRGTRDRRPARPHTPCSYGSGLKNVPKTQ